VRTLWDALATPAADVWTEHVVLGELNVDFRQDPPTPGPATPRLAVKVLPEKGAESELSVTVLG
jgi:hypothetical protein